MSELNKDLLAQVDKHLPQLIGQQLRERLELADKADEALKAAERYAKENAELRAAVSQVQAERARLHTAFVDLEARERKVELQELELKLRIEHANDKAAFAERTLATVFKNREVTHTMIGTLPAGVAQPSQYTNYPTALTAPVSTTTTVEG